MFNDQPLEYGPSYMFVLRFILSVTDRSECASINNPNTTVQYFLKSRWNPITISLDKYFIKIPFPDGSVFNHNITK